jgi:ribose 5-phosphate isomerase
MGAGRIQKGRARLALDFVRPDMQLGLGIGSTAAHFIDPLGEQVG